jgi:transcriptional regulator with XRE-family HTH domain
MKVKLTNDQFRMMRSVYKLSMKEWGNLLDISDTYVNLIEKNKRRLTERVVQRLVNELELTENKLAQILAIYEKFQRRN